MPAVPDAPRRRLDALAAAAEALEAAGLDAPRRTAEWLVCEAAGCTRAQLFAYPEAELAPEAAAALDAMLRRRLAREPLQYVLGHADFYGLRLAVAPAVLIPRPETEGVVEAALTLLRGVGQPRVLDVGTGSGCIPLAVKHERPDAAVWACDVSPAALAVARANAAALGLEVAFFEADVLAPSFADDVPGRLDLLVSNPPYIPDHEACTLEPEVLDHEPHMALFSGDDPLRFYRVLVELGTRLLAPGGHLVLEGHADHAAATAALLAPAGYTDVAVLPDLAGLPRTVVGRREG